MRKLSVMCPSVPAVMSQASSRPHHAGPCAGLLYEYGALIVNPNGGRYCGDRQNIETYRNLNQFSLCVTNYIICPHTRRGAALLHTIAAVVVLVSRDLVAVRTPRYHRRHHPTTPPADPLPHSRVGSSRGWHDGRNLEANCSNARVVCCTTYRYI